MRSAFLVTVFCLVTAGRASLAASADTTITEFLLNPQNPNHICVVVAFAPFEAAESQDGGRTFAAVRGKSISPELVPGTSAGNFRYVTAGYGKYHLYRLFRSEDGGATWEETVFNKFLHEQLEKVADQQRESFFKRYADRFPSRTETWTTWFFIFSGIYLIAGAWLLRGKRFWRNGGHLALSALALLGLWYVLLESCDAMFFLTISGHAPGLQYWHDAPEWDPAAKLGIIFQVASSPVALFAFFIAILPILPASVTVIGGYLNRRAGDKAWPLMACRAFALLLWSFLVVATCSPWPFGGFWG